MPRCSSWSGSSTTRVRIRSSPSAAAACSISPRPRASAPTRTASTPCWRVNAPRHPGCRSWPCRRPRGVAPRSATPPSSPTGRVAGNAGSADPGVAARDAIVDPELMRGAPAPVVAAAGFDAIAHAVETSASRAATEPVIERGGAALRSLLDAVPRAVRAAVPRAMQDADAMGAAAYAALLMGVNLATSTTCLPHRLQYPVGARTGTGHAQGVAALMPAWLARTRAAAPDSLARLAVAAGLAPASATPDEAAHALVDRVIAHLDATGMTIAPGRSRDRPRRRRRARRRGGRIGRERPGSERPRRPARPLSRQPVASRTEESWMR